MSVCVRGCVACVLFVFSRAGYNGSMKRAEPWWPGSERQSCLVCAAFYLFLYFRSQHALKIWLPGSQKTGCVPSGFLPLPGCVVPLPGCIW